MLRAVLDANVYVSAALRPEGPPGQIIERFLRETAFQLVLSQTILNEVLRAFTYPQVRKYLRLELDPAQWFADIAVLAQLVSGEHAVPRLSKDPDDDKYIAAAVEGQASFIVAGDSHLLAVKEHEGIRIVRPRDFLDRLNEIARSDARG